MAESFDEPAGEEVPAGAAVATVAVDDVDMGEGGGEGENGGENGGDTGGENGGDTGGENGGDGVDETGDASTAEAPPTRTSFATYLASPVVTLVVGGEAADGAADGPLTLHAHEALLAKSPYFAERLAERVQGEDRTVVLADQGADAVGCFLEYLYTGDYFPRKLAGHAHALERDPDAPAVDETGAQLLKHARVYTLGGRLGLPALQALASAKIHCVQSTAQGEIAYARYVYAHTRADDATVRHPVAKFWATRSHTLRAEAEAEFQALCLEHPQFAYDVLTRVLDEKLKRERDDRLHGSPSQAGTRKRARNSASVQ